MRERVTGYVNTVPLTAGWIGQADRSRVRLKRSAHLQTMSRLCDPA